MRSFLTLIVACHERKSKKREQKSEHKNSSGGCGLKWNELFLILISPMEDSVGYWLNLDDD